MLEISLAPGPRVLEGTVSNLQIVGPRSIPGGVNNLFALITHLQ